MIFWTEERSEDLACTIEILLKFSRSILLDGSEVKSSRRAVIPLVR